MKSDTLKTIGGVVMIGLIVIATFLYGNKQRQDQVRRDDALRASQQQTVATTAPKAATSTGSTNQAPGGATAAVTAPAAASLQTTAPASSTQSGKLATTTPAPAPAKTTAPAATPTKTPATGSEGLVAVFATTLMLAAWRLARGSRDRLRVASIARLA